MTLELPEALLQAHLGELKMQFDAGNKASLFAAIRFCGNEQVILPEWVVHAFFQATNAWYNYSVKTLDEAFGVTWPKGKHINAAKKKREKMFAVHNLVTDAKRAGVAIDLDLYDQISNQLGINKTDAIKYSSEAAKIMAMPHAIDALLEPFKVNSQIP